jgi:hypothetical protein
MSEPLRKTAAPIATLEDAELAIDSLYRIMDLLEATVAEETARVRGGHIRGATELGETKRDLALRYGAESERVKTASKLIRSSLPEALEQLRRRHDSFQKILQTNMTVLATAHAVSEGVIRGVSGELARKRTPSTYGASGKANRPGPAASQPLALSRTL